MSFLQVKNISKSYSGTYALQGVNFSAEEGQVLAVCGENGAGKSTLMKILAGVIQPNAGEVLINGTPVRIQDPHHAFDLGIRTVYQELSLVRHLTVTENILMGRLPTRNFAWWVDWPEGHRQAEEIFKNLGFTGIRVRDLTSRLSVSFQQMVEIAKAVVEKPKVLILDEPSAVLSTEELKHLYRLIGHLKTEGATILYISHRLEEVFEISDKISVLKDGETVGNVDTRDVTPNDLIRMMVGRPLSAIYPEKKANKGANLLSVRGLRREGAFENISFSLAKGEILGLFGLVGSGRSAVVRCIFGADRESSGEIYLNDTLLKIKSPADAVKAKIGLVTEERKLDGLALSCSILDNVGLASMKQISTRSILNRKRQRVVVSQKVDEMSIKPREVKRLVRVLSGGNQQKVVLAKWMLLKNLKVLLLDEPTRGVDIGTKVEIYNLIQKLAMSGVGVLLISSELTEILGMSDRVLVMRDGRLVGEFTNSECTEETILTCAAGVYQTDSAPEKQLETAT